MKMTTFKSMCPHLYQTLDILAHNNGIREFPKVWISVETQTKFPPMALEKQASQLTDIEKETLADGEESEIVDLVMKRKVGKLCDFVTFCFRNN